MVGLLLFETVLICSLDCPGNHRDPPPSACWTSTESAGFKACATAAVEIYKVYLNQLSQWEKRPIRVGMENVCLLQGYLTTDLL